MDMWIHLEWKIPSLICQSHTEYRFQTILSIGPGPSILTQAYGSTMSKKADLSLQTHPSYVQHVFSKPMLPKGAIVYALFKARIL